jgi:hypothetical protein
MSSVKALPYTVVRDVIYSTDAKRQDRDIDKYMLDLYLPKTSTNGNETIIYSSTNCACNGVCTCGQNDMVKTSCSDSTASNTKLGQTKPNGIDETRFSNWICSDTCEKSEYIQCSAPATSNPRTGRTTSKSNSQSKSPMVVFVHGGGWRRGDRRAWRHYLYEDMNLLAAFCFKMFNLYGNVGETLARNGIACAVMSYPLTQPRQPWDILERIISYIISVTFLSVVWICVALLSTLNGHVMAAFTKLLVAEHQVRGWNHMLHILLCHLLMSNLGILIFMTIKKDKFRLSNFGTFASWLCVLTTVASTANIRPEVIIPVTVMATLVITQWILVSKTTTSTPGYHGNVQAQCVADCVRWVKAYGQSSGRVDTASIHLMGHSAGGHLVSLVALDGQYLQRARCSIRDIKVRSAGSPSTHVITGCACLLLVL